MFHLLRVPYTETDHVMSTPSHSCGIVRARLIHVPTNGRCDGKGTISALSAEFLMHELTSRNPVFRVHVSGYYLFTLIFCCDSNLITVAV